MPVALAIAPVSNATTVSPTVAPASSSADDAFGQVLRLARDAPPDSKNPPLPVAPATGLLQPPKSAQLLPSSLSAAKPARILLGDNQPSGRQNPLSADTTGVATDANPPTSIEPLSNSAIRALSAQSPAPIPQAASDPTASQPDVLVAALTPPAAAAVATGISAAPRPIPAAQAASSSKLPKSTSALEATQATVDPAIAGSIRVPLPLALPQPIMSDVAPPAMKASAAVSPPSASETDQASARPLPTPSHVTEASGSASSSITAQKAGPGATEVVADIFRPVGDAPLLDPTTTGAEFSSMPTPNATTATAAAAAATSTHASDVASPTTQIAPPLLTLAKTADGNQQMTVRLHPADLGMVQVRIERTQSGATQVEFSADKEDTLQALARDQVALHRTLDDAGIPAAGRTVTFHIVQPAPSSSGTGGGDLGSGQHPGGTNSGSTDADTASNDGRGSHPAREANRWTGSRLAGNPLITAGATPVGNAQTYRVGLDITA